MFHLAQINLAYGKATLDDPLMAGFVARLEEINALAERSPGFIWRLQDTDVDAMNVRLYEDERILVNMSVWRTFDDLRQFVYYSAHAGLLRQRQAWFEKFSGAQQALWWTPAGHVPNVIEARARLVHLEVHGPAPFAFTFRRSFPAGDAVPEATNWAELNASPPA